MTRRTGGVVVALTHSPSLRTKLAAEHPATHFAESAHQLFALLATKPYAFVLDATHADTRDLLGRLASIDGARLIVVTADVTKERLVGAHLVVCEESLREALAVVAQPRATPTLDFTRMLQISVLDGQLDQALETVADQIAECLDVDRCVISVRGDSTGGAASGSHTWDSFAWTRTAERCRAASLTRATLIAPASEQACESYLAVPLDTTLGSYGFVGLVAETAFVFTAEQQAALVAVAARLATELSWRAIHQRTSDELDRIGNAPGHDLLLAMWNRMATAELANMYVSASKRSSLPLGVAIVDVLDLQGINTRYGLETGDRLLRRIADSIRATIRAEDVVGRWAGDKVAIILHGTPIEGSQRMAERLRAALDARPLDLPSGGVLALPATVGIAALAPNEDAISLMNRAVYAAKQARDGGISISRAATGPAPRISQPLEIGDELRAMVGGAYRLQHEISRGGMGVVYRAEDLALERPVALKMLRPDLAEDHAFVEQLRVEAAMLARLHHPNLVQIYSFGQSGGDSYFVMELVEGEALQQAIERHRLERTQMPLHELVSVIEEIGSAIDALHDRGIVHRDVKPANVIRDPFRNRAVLVDVGIARRFGQFVEAAGTPGYVAPEVIAGQEATPRSDVYGLAATAYALLTLAAPWGDGNDVIARQLSGKPVAPPSSLRAEIAGADKIITAALAADPKLRPTSAGQLARALRDALSVATPAPKPEKQRFSGQIVMPRRASAKTRGVVFRSVVRAIGVREVQRLRDSLGSTHPDVAAALTDTAPLAWLPTEVLSRLLAVAPAHIDRDAGKLARDIARATVRASFRRFFPASAATLVPERTLSAIRNVWSQYQTWGTVSPMPVNATETVVRIAEPLRDPELCAWTEGLLEQLVVLSGGRTPIVDHEACITRGDAACLYRVTWNRQA
ncbi:MAG TPA: protein kinase [Kofleriaceae bacterium]